MKIGVISDTHIPKRAKFLPEIVLETFKGTGPHYSCWRHNEYGCYI